MSEKGLTPSIAIPEAATRIAFKNIIEGIRDLLAEEGETLANEWAEAAGIAQPNIFMKEKAARLLNAKLADFIDAVLPEPSQYTAEHVDAYLTPLSSDSAPDPVQ